MKTEICVEYMTSQVNKNKLSPFVYHTVDASQLEVDGLESIALKFRKATFDDREANLAAHESGQLKEIFPEEDSISDKSIIGMADLIYNFLTKESKRLLAKIQLTDIDEDGNSVEIKTPIKQKFKMLFFSNENAYHDVYGIFLSIHGLDINDLDQIEKINQEMEKQVKKNNMTTSKKSQSSNS